MLPYDASCVTDGPVALTADLDFKIDSHGRCKLQWKCFEDHLCFSAGVLFFYSLAFLPVMKCATHNEGLVTTFEV